MEANVALPQSSVPYAIINILRIAFVQALQPSINRSINTAAEKSKKEKKTFLQKVFSKNKKEK
jgi:hypothetical protein